MSYAYTTAALHRFVRGQMIEPGRSHQARPGEDFFTDILLKSGVPVEITDKPATFRALTVADVVAWRDGIGRKYRSQLGEPLTWDEASALVRSADAFSSADSMLHYLASVLHRHGADARSLLNAPRPSDPEIEAADAHATRLGFAGRFPQFALGAEYWLPFQRNLIIEEPDWAGRKRRFGSVDRFADELGELRQLIAQADPRATAWTATGKVPRHDVLAAAWFASEIVLPICTAAQQQRLPLWIG